MSMLIQHDWPGNVRELQNVMERAVALAEEKEITLKDIILTTQLEELLKR